MEMNWDLTKGQWWMNMPPASSFASYQIGNAGECE
jgi:hypothetical protein